MTTSQWKRAHGSRSSRAGTRRFDGLKIGAAHAAALPASARPLSVHATRARAVAREVARRHDEPVGAGGQPRGSSACAVPRSSIARVRLTVTEARTTRTVTTAGSSSRKRSRAPPCHCRDRHARQPRGERVGDLEPARRPRVVRERLLAQRRRGRRRRRVAARVGHDHVAEHRRRVHLADEPVRPGRGERVRGGRRAGRRDRRCVNDQFVPREATLCSAVVPAKLQVTVLADPDRRRLRRPAVVVVVGLGPVDGLDRLRRRRGRDHQRGRAPAARKTLMPSPRAAASSPGRRARARGSGTRSGRCRARTTAAPSPSPSAARRSCPSSRAARPRAPARCCARARGTGSRGCASGARGWSC